MHPITAEHGQIGHPDLVRHRVRLAPEIISSAPGVRTIFGLSLVNCHVLDAPEGLILIDSGHSADEGAELLCLIRTVSERPIRAILLTHSHYVHGLSSLIAGAPAGVQILGHPRLEANLRQRLSGFEPTHARRTGIENGSALGGTGPDGVIAPSPAWRGPSGFVPLTGTLGPSRTAITIAGLPVIAEESLFDTDDGLCFRFPTLDTVAHNLVTAQFPNFGSVAGGRFRDPLPWLAAVSALAGEPPEHLLPCHGRPLSGRDRVRERLEVNHDAIRWLTDQIARRAADGATIPELIRDVQLPLELAEHPDLRRLYGAVGHTVAAIAQSEIGFWDGSAEALMPMHPEAQAAALARELGGAEALLERADAALQRQELAWAAHLAAAGQSCFAADDPQHRQAGKLRAAALRGLARGQSAWTVRNAMLTLAAVAEGTLPAAALRRPVDAARALRAPIADLVGFLRRTVPDWDEGTVRSLDAGEGPRWNLHKTRGVLRITALDTAAPAPADLVSTRQALVDAIVAGTPWAAIRESAARVHGQSH